MHLAESSSTLSCLWTGLSLPVALHPASRRRSYLPLRTGQCSRPIGTFTLLSVRTLRRTPPVPSGRRNSPYLGSSGQISVCLESDFRRVQKWTSILGRENNVDQD